jgi:hypothetical protein
MGVKIEILDNIENNSLFIILLWAIIYNLSTGPLILY